MLKKTLAALAASALVLGAVPGALRTAAAEAAAPEPDAAAAGEMVAENDRLILRCTEGGALTLEDKETGSLLQSVPEPPEGQTVTGLANVERNSTLLVEYASEKNIVGKTNSFVGSVGEDGLTIEKIPNGVRLNFRFPEESTGFFIPVEVTLQDDYMQASIITEEIEEAGASRILTISLLPFFGAGSKADEGYIFVPDGSGAVINFNNGKNRYDQYDEPVFGKDDTLTTSYVRTNKQKIYLPVFAVQKGAYGHMAVITEGKANASIFANVAGSAKSLFFNNAGASFTYRSKDIVILAEAAFNPREVTTLAAYPNDTGRYTVRYYPLRGEETSLGGIAAKYRKYLLDEGLLNTRKRDVRATPKFNLQLVGGVKKPSSFLGFPITKYMPLTTYSGAADMAASLREQGVDNLMVQFLGWAKGGVNASIDTSLKPESKLGGEKGLNALKDALAASGTDLYLDVEVQKMYKDGWGVAKRFDGVKKISGIPNALQPIRLDLLRPDTKAASYNLLKPLKLETILEKLRPDPGFTLTYGGLGSTLYSDFDESAFFYRTAFQDIVTGQLGAIFERQESVMLDTACEYALKYVDCIAGAPLTSSRFDVEDYEVPFYQMVISGWLEYSGNPVNLEGSPDEAVLQSIGAGSGLCFQLMSEDPSRIKNSAIDGCYAGGFDGWSAYAAESYGRMQAAYEAIGTREIADFRAVADRVSVTVFANGKELCVNLSQAAFEYGGATVAPGDFAVVG